MINYNKAMIKLLFLFSPILLIHCENPCDPPIPPPTREEAIPSDAVKMTPASDNFAPVNHSDEFYDPVPLGGPVNTAGAEDAPVMSPDGNTFYFFFTPDVDVLPEKQLLDEVTGLWWSKKINGSWMEPERIILNDDLSLDGPLCLQGDTLWFASFRAGNYLDDGDVYIATYDNGKWGNWQNAGQQLNQEFNIGEMYTSADGNTMYFHRGEFGGFGGYDLWSTERTNGNWTEPLNLGETVNSEFDDGMPCLSPDGNELWFNRISSSGYTGPALYRSVKTDSGWTAPVEMISNFAGDPAIDSLGNIYFTHHFYSQDIEMIEADIYVAYRK